MGLREFLSKLGFTENPFQFTNADEEEHLQSYFVPPPYFHSVWGDPQFPKSQVIFAPRGGGKTAQRRMIEYRAESENVFVITYDRFEKLGGADLAALSLDYHLRNIIEIALLGFLLEYHERGIHAPSFTKIEREQIDKLSHYYLSNISRFEALEALASRVVGTYNLDFQCRSYSKGYSSPKDRTGPRAKYRSSQRPLKVALTGRARFNPEHWIQINLYSG